MEKINLCFNIELSKCNYIYYCLPNFYTTFELLYMEIKHNKNKDLNFLVFYFYPITIFFIILLGFNSTQSFRLKIKKKH